jgi:hypothetical protein
MSQNQKGKQAGGAAKGKKAPKGGAGGAAESKTDNVLQAVVGDTIVHI